MTPIHGVLQVKNLTLSYGSQLIQRDLNFSIRPQEIFVIMGGSGCGKSTLLKHLIGLYQPAQGEVLYAGRNLWGCTEAERRELMKNFGVSYQSGALISSMTLAENIAMPLEMHTELGAADVRELASLKLRLVGLAGFEDYYPSEISGGMKKRAALARAIALDPDLLFFDEPSAGLDPVSAKLLDDLIRSLRDSLGATVVIVTHELASIFAIADNSVFLDAESKTMLTTGNPRELLAHCDIPQVQTFLRRGELQESAQP